VAVLIGDERGSHAPIVLVDTLDQTLVVYDYAYDGDYLELGAARTYKYDKQIPSFNHTRGPSVDEVKRQLKKIGL
jgi:glycerophosphoryl diester phosphodiesterase